MKQRGFPYLKKGFMALLYIQFINQSVLDAGSKFIDNIIIRFKSSITWNSRLDAQNCFYHSGCFLFLYKEKKKKKKKKD